MLFFSGPRVAARGDARIIPHLDAISRKYRPSHSALDAESRKCMGRRARKIHSLLCPSTGPRVAARGDARIIPHLDAISRKYRPSHSALDAESRKCMGRRARKIHSLLCPSTGPRVAARGDVWSYRTPMRYLVRIVLASESLSGKWGGRVGNPRKNCIFVLPENLKTRDRYGD